MLKTSFVISTIFLVFFVTAFNAEARRKNSSEFDGEVRIYEQENPSSKNSSETIEKTLDDLQNFIFPKNFPTNSPSMPKMDIKVVREKIIIAQRTENGKKVKDIKIVGDLYINGQWVCKTFESEQYRVQQGSYKMENDITSPKGKHVLRQSGELDSYGEFSLKVKNAKRHDGKKMTEVKLHGGGPDQTYEGCTGTGIVMTNKKTGKRYVAEIHALKIAYKQYFGSDSPDMSPAEADINITYIDVPKNEQSKIYVIKNGKYVPVKEKEPQEPPNNSNDGRDPQLRLPGFQNKDWQIEPWNEPKPNLNLPDPESDRLKKQPA